MIRWLKCTGIVALTWVLGACENRNAEQTKKLDDAVARLDRLEKKVDSMGRPNRPPAPQQPDPSTVYSVPVDGDAIVGPKIAKVTIVEASDFA